MDTFTLTAAHVATVVSLCGLIKRYAPAVFRLGFLPKRYLWVLPCLLSLAGAVSSYAQGLVTPGQAVEMVLSAFLSSMGAHAWWKQWHQRPKDDDADSDSFLPPPSLYTAFSVVFLLAGCASGAPTPETAECKATAAANYGIRLQAECASKGLDVSECPAAERIDALLDVEWEACG